MSGIAELDHRLNQMILNGQAMAGFEEFYDDRVTMTEPRSGPRHGKAANHEFQKKFFDSIEEVKNVDLRAFAVHGDTSFSEWRWDVKFKDGQDVQMEEVSRRRWRDNRVIDERFYYDTGNRRA